MLLYISYHGYLLLQGLAAANFPEIDDDPLSSVIDDLAKLTTDAAETVDKSQIPLDGKPVNDTHGAICPKTPHSQNYSQDKQVEICNDEEDLEESVGTPDSLEICKINNKPIPPPRTRLPPPLSTTGNVGAGTSSLLNGNSHKQIRSESDHELLLSLTSSGNNIIF